MNSINGLVDRYLCEDGRQKVAKDFVSKGWKTDWDREIVAAQYDGKLPSGAQKFVDGFAKGDFKVAIIYDFDKEEDMVRVVVKRGKEFFSDRMSKSDASNYEKIISNTKKLGGRNWSEMGN